MQQNYFLTVPGKPPLLSYCEKLGRVVAVISYDLASNAILAQ